MTGGVTQLLTAGGLIGGLLLLVFLLIKFGNKTSRDQGRAEGISEASDRYNAERTAHNEKVAEENRQIVEEVGKTNETHDRLERDPDYRDRVRDRFTRD